MGSEMCIRDRYMHDGGIVHDEQTEIGEVAPTARKALYSLFRKTVDDDLAGVSALMKAVPHPSDITKKKPAAKTTKKAASKSKAKAKPAKKGSKK